MPAKPKDLLKNIEFPEDLRKLDKSQIEAVCQDLRDFLIDNAAEYGGHFAASLGVVELSVALHYVFNTPEDKIVWDVGHQAYGHKILTGRREQFHTNRQYKGISPFPKPSESEYDAFAVGHSSTSISAALGMAVASRLQQQPQKQHIAVIGDGSMTGGIAFEGLNNAGAVDSNVLVILNDNNMAIDPNVGALKDYLTDITSSSTYNKVRSDVWELLGKFSKFGDSAREIASRVEKMLIGVISKESNFFESLNFRYFGPIDGHDVDHLVHVLEDLKKIPGPKILHLLTSKGKGFSHAEKDPLTWHAPSGKFDRETGEIQKADVSGPKPPKYPDVFGHTLVEMAKADSRVVGITPAMPSGSSMKFLFDEMPDRAFDVGIAEQHAVTFSAGMAAQGLVPFCNIYSTFMQRAFDQVVHDVALQDWHVIFCLDRGGLVGADGPTHHGAYDIAFMRSIPNMIVSAPRNEVELRNLMQTAIEAKKPFSIRYPRGAGVTVDWKQPLQVLEVGKGVKLADGQDIAILTLGTPGNFATEALGIVAAEGITPAHYDLRFAKPLDGALLDEVFTNFSKVLIVEDGCLQGGVGSAVLEYMADHEYAAKVRRLGIPDRFVTHGTQPELWRECEYDTLAIVNALKELA
jgi:1-deoxy-D-xylulose-5-phosphate synthase